MEAPPGHCKHLVIKNNSFELNLYVAMDAPNVSLYLSEV